MPFVVLGVGAALILGGLWYYLQRPSQAELDAAAEEARRKEWTRAANAEEATRVSAGESSGVLASGTGERFASSADASGERLSVFVSSGMTAPAGAHETSEGTFVRLTETPLTVQGTIARLTGGDMLSEDADEGAFIELSYLDCGIFGKLCVNDMPGEPTEGGRPNRVRIDDLRGLFGRAAGGKNPDTLVASDLYRILAGPLPLDTDHRANAMVVRGVFGTWAAGSNPPADATSRSSAYWGGPYLLLGPYETGTGPGIGFGRTVTGARYEARRRWIAPWLEKYRAQLARESVYSTYSGSGGSLTESVGRITIGGAG